MVTENNFENADKLAGEERMRITKRDGEERSKNTREELD